MSKLTCVCGASINLSDIPQRGAFDLLPEILREPLIDTIMSTHDQAASRQDFERQVYCAHGHLGTPGILYIVECLACARLAVFARASDTQPAFWFQREQTNIADIAGTMSDLVDHLVQGDLPPGWQDQPELPSSSTMLISSSIAEYGFQSDHPSSAAPGRRVGALTRSEAPCHSERSAAGVPRRARACAE